MNAVLFRHIGNDIVVFVVDIVVVHVDRVVFDVVVVVVVVVVVFVVGDGGGDDMRDG